MSKRITIEELESYLWHSAVLLRSNIDAGAYKQYIVFSSTQNPSVNPKNYDENGDFCIFPPDESKTTMKTGIFVISRSTLHSRSPRSQPYTLRRATLHNVGSYVGFFAPILHT